MLRVFNGLGCAVEHRVDSEWEDEKIHEIRHRFDKIESILNKIMSDLIIIINI